MPNATIRISKHNTERFGNFRSKYYNVKTLSWGVGRMSGHESKFTIGVWAQPQGEATAPTMHLELSREEAIALAKYINERIEQGW